MAPLTTDRISVELLSEALVILEQITTGVTVLALNGTQSPEQSPRIRRLLQDLLVLTQQAEEELGTYRNN